MTDSAKTVLNDEGVFSACMTRQSVCNYSCCKFREDEWIMLLPGEYELAQQQNMKFGHLNIVNKGHAIYADCLKPCQSGDFKPVDCSWYPLFPANASATLFLATDNRKCPIPIDELVEKMLDVQASALTYERLFPGTLEKLVVLIQDFVGYVPLPYKIDNGNVVKLSIQELVESGCFTNPALNRAHFTKQP